MKNDIYFTLEGKKYYVPTTLEDISYRNYCRYMDELNIYEEKDTNDKYLDGEKVTIKLNPSEWSDTFKLDKYRRIINILTDIPLDILSDIDSDNILTMISIIEAVFVLPNITDVANEIDLIGKKYILHSLSEWSFAQWCEYEELSKKSRYISCVYALIESGKTFDRYYRHRDELEMIFDLPASHLIPLYNYLLNEIMSVRTIYKFLFDDSGSNNDSPNMSKHYSIWGWYAVAQNLAESGAMGTYKDVLDANCLLTLEYLNIKASKDIAENNDYKLKNK